MAISLLPVCLGIHRSATMGLMNNGYVPIASGDLCWRN